MLKFKLSTFLCILLLIFIIVIISPLVYSQTDENVGDKIDGYPVVLDDERLFIIQTPTGSFTAKERANAIERRLEAIANDELVDTNSIKLEKSDDNINLIANNKVILTITEKDAEAARKPQQELAQNYLSKIQKSILEYRRERTPLNRVLGVVYTIITTLSLFLIFKILNFLFPRIDNLIKPYSDRVRVNSRTRDINILVSSYIIEGLAGSIKFIRIALTIAICYLYIPLIFSFFPLTRPIGQKLFNYITTALKIIWTAFVNYLPNIFIISLIILTTYYILRLVKLIFLELERGNLSIPGFYQEWAKPTYDLVRLLIIALGAVLVFPYLPGFNSPAFQGISVFLGILFSLGSTSAIANTVGGIILIYTRAFKLGDRVQISDVVGDIEEKTLLVTRIRTPKNVLVTIPNSEVLGSTIINYSASARDTGIPLIVHTTVTLGYDLPWRKVYGILIEAANMTEYILKDPPPFVLQNSLNDFYVSYELNAYTNETHTLPKLYSDLHQNIQDKCNEVGIEIMSPHYSALRDGNQSTIPSDYLPKDYTVPGFKVSSENDKKET